MKSFVALNLAPLEALNLNIENNRGAYVKVGLLGGKAARKGDPINNPSLGFEQEFGNMSHHLPARSFLRMPLRDQLPKRMQAIGKAVWQALIDSKGIRAALQTLGVYGEEVVDEAFDTGGWGQWAPWSDSYAQKREQSWREKHHKMKLIGPIQFRLLVRSGQMEKAVTSEVVGGKASG